MSDDLSQELRAFEGSEALANGDFSVCIRGADRIEAQAAEIARLRAELTTARIELEHAARQIDCQCGKRDLVLSELRELGSLHAENVCPRDRSCLAILAADMRAAALDNRPSEEIIREDRDAWPDHQANDPIRDAALEGKKDE